MEMCLSSFKLLCIIAYLYLLKEKKNANEIFNKRNFR